MRMCMAAPRECELENLSGGIARLSRAKGLQT
jgi:hypothetical protein